MMEEMNIKYGKKKSIQTEELRGLLKNQQIGGQKKGTHIDKWRKARGSMLYTPGDA